MDADRVAGLVADELEAAIGLGRADVGLGGGAQPALLRAVEEDRDELAAVDEAP
ncbi:MAG: hypothetical protein U0168_29165 [Nannocystaceae bacterium]